MTALRWLDSLLARLLWVPRAVIFLCALILLWYTADREVPYHVVSVEPAFGRAGERIVIHAAVQRDMTRRCDLTLSRQIIDAHGVGHSSDSDYLSADVRAEMERRTPGEAHIAFTIPSNAAPGPAVLYTSREYRCNKVHHVWPITLVTAMPFTVLPPSQP